MKTKLLLCVNLLLVFGIVLMWKKVFFVHTKSDFYIWGILAIIVFVSLAVFLIKDYYPQKNKSIWNESICYGYSGVVPGA